MAVRASAVTVVSRLVIPIPVVPPWPVTSCGFTIFDVVVVVGGDVVGGGGDVVVGGGGDVVVVVTG